MNFGETRSGGFDANILADQVRSIGEDYADKRAAADLLDSTTKSVLAQLTLRFRAENPDASRKEAEDMAMASADYRDHINAVVESQRIANRARANWESVQAFVRAMQTAAANRRAEMNLR